MIRLLLLLYCVADADSGVSDVLDEQAPAAVTPLRQRETSSPINSRHQRVLPASSSSSSSSSLSQTPASLSSVISAHHRDDVTDHVTVKEGT